MELKQKLATLIDAYADAKRSGNELLVQLATSQLQEFFTTHDVVPAAPAISETPGTEQE